MPAGEPFTGIYSLKLRDLLSCITGQELQVFMALVTYVNDTGTCWPGVRELSVVTTLPTMTVSRILENLEKYHLVIVVRRDERDEFTSRMKPNVYALSPQIVLISNPDVWYRHNASITPVAPYIMPESTFPREIAQPDRITEPESGNQKQGTRITAPDGAAALPKADVATRRSPTSGENGGAQSAAGSENRANSAQRHTPPPSSAASPSRPLSFNEGVTANAIRRQVTDMSADKACELIVKYGADRVNAAVTSYMARREKTEIKRPTGWIIRNLESGARYK